MTQLVSLAKVFLIPGSFWFLVLGLTAGVCLLYLGPAARWGRRLLLALVLVYGALSLPVVAETLQALVVPDARPLPDDAPPLSAVDTIVVLGAGAVSIGEGPRQIHLPSSQTARNVIEGARLLALLGGGRVIVSGGIPRPDIQSRSEAAVMRDALVALGVAPDRIVLEDRSNNTAEQAVNVAPLVAPGRPFLLVTGPVHLRRAVRLFEARGLSPVPSPSYVVEPSHTAGLRRFVPSVRALPASTQVMYEVMATLWAWAGGRV